MILLDTCALLWWTLEPERLSSAARKACDRIPADGAFLSSISIWEIGIKLKKNTLVIGIGLERYVRRLKRLGTLEIVPVDEDLWVRNIGLEWHNRDPVDRTIVATAMLRGLPIVTKDNRISQFYDRVIW